MIATYRIGQYSLIRNQLVCSIILMSCFIIVMIQGGPGLTPDSIAYREIALNILHGKGPVNNEGALANHWPPLYPAILAFFKLVSGLPIAQAAILMQCTLFFIFLQLLFRIAQQSQLGNFSSSFFVLLTCLLPATYNFSKQMSEGLFNTFLLLLVSIGLDYKDRPRPFLLGLISGLLFLTRYAGIAFVAGTGMYILLLEAPSWKRVIKKILLFGIGPAIASGGWVFMEYVMKAKHFNRIIVFHPLSAQKLISFSEQINRQVFPPLQSLFSYSGLIVLAIFILLSAYLVFHKNKNIFGSHMLYLWLCLIAFLGLIFVTCLYLDAHTPLDSRIWSPGAPIMLLMLFLMLQKLNSIWRITLILILVGCNIYPSFKLWNSFRCNGDGLSSRQWRESEVLKSSERHIYSGKKIYSNGADLLDCYFNESGKYRIDMMPLKYYPTSGNKNPKFENEMVKVISKVKDKSAVVIYFNNIRWRKYLEDSAGLIARKSGLIITQYRDGLILSN
jgi:hypothetical protein